MQEVFEKIIEKFEEKIKEYDERIERRKGACHFDETENMRKLDDRARGIEQAIEIVKQESEKYKGGWIPFVRREMTEDEKKSFGNLNFMLDCQLPDEDEEILITYKFKDELYVDVDTFMRDGSECYLDSGRDFVTEAVAWRKKPVPYQPNGE